MSRLKNRKFQGLIVTAICALGVLVACSTDSPTAPVQVPPPPTDGDGVPSGEDPFITSITPTTGTGKGGTHVTIGGVGLVPPLRVLFGDAPGQVQSVNSNGTEIRVITPPYGGDYDQDDCDFGDTGVLDGNRNSPTPVDVEVELSIGGGDSLAAGFTYIPLDTTCYEGTNVNP